MLISLRFQTANISAFTNLLRLIISQAYRILLETAKVSVYRLCSALNCSNSWYFAAYILSV